MELVSHMFPGVNEFQSYDRIAAVCGLRFLQFALPEGLDGVQQGVAIPIHSIRRGRRGRMRRAGGRGIQRRCRWRVRLGPYVKGRRRAKGRNGSDKNLQSASSLAVQTETNVPVVDGGVGEEGQVGGELAPEPERRQNTLMN